MRQSKKDKQFDKVAAVGFFVNFCAIFSLILIVGLLTVADSFGSTPGGVAALSQSLVGKNECQCPATDCEVCGSVAPAVLFPVSSDHPAENAIEIAVGDDGFSVKELSLVFSSSRTLRITNNGVNSHSFAMDAIGLNSGAIAPGQSVTVLLEGFSQDSPSLEFHSDIASDSREDFSGLIILE